MSFHLDTLFYLHNVKSSELTEELSTENIWKEAGGTSKPTPKLTPSPEGTPGHTARGWKLSSSGSFFFLGINTMQGGLSENSTFPSPQPHFPVQPTSKEDGLTMTWLIEIDESVDDFLTKFAPGIYRAFLSVHVRPAECLCWPSGQQWHHTSSCLVFLVVLGFFHRVAHRPGLLSHMKTRPQPQGLSHQSCSFTVWIFTSILPFVLLNDKLSKYIQGLNSNVWVLQKCLLQMLLIKYLPSHYPLGCIFLLTLEQLGSRRDLSEFG